MDSKVEVENTSKTENPIKFSNILGFDIVDARFTDFVNYLQNAIESNKKLRVFAINPEKVIKASNDEKVDFFLKNAEVLIPDGIGILKAAQYLKSPLESRITGVDTFQAILELASKNSFTIYLFGSKEEVLKKAVDRIEKKYGNIIAGYKDGYSNRDTIVDEINKSGASALFVGLGSPQQEIFLFENYNKLNVNIMQGVGGTFDVFSGEVKRAPLFFQNINLEWFYRLLQNPSRITRVIKMAPFLKIVKGYKRQK